jgi:predicted nuclease of predicted toxin-antitoxin system
VRDGKACTGRKSENRQLQTTLSSSMPRRADRSCVTHDLDYSAILAATGARAPSVVQVRFQDVLSQQFIELLVTALRQFEKELDAGALLVNRRQHRRIPPIACPLSRDRVRARAIRFRAVRQRRVVFGRERPSTSSGCRPTRDGRQCRRGRTAFRPELPVRSAGGLRQQSGALLNCPCAGEGAPPTTGHRSS